MEKRITERDFPAYVRGWENYPSGRKYERVTRLEKGRQVSVTRFTDANGFAEYSVATRNESLPEDSFVEFATATFGYGSSTSSYFDALHGELIRFSADCRR